MGQRWCRYQSRSRRRFSTWHFSMVMVALCYNGATALIATQKIPLTLCRRGPTLDLHLHKMEVHGLFAPYSNDSKCTKHIAMLSHWYTHPSCATFSSGVDYWAVTIKIRLGFCTFAVPPQVPGFRCTSISRDTGLHCRDAEFILLGLVIYSSEDE